MTDQPRSARFQKLLGAAVQEYEKKVGVTLIDWENEDRLAFRLQHCYTIDGITTLLQDRTQDSDDIRQHDRISKSIKATVSILTPIYVDDDAGPVPVRQNVLRPEGLSCISDRFYRNYSYGRKRYIIFSVSYWPYVHFLA